MDLLSWLADRGYGEVQEVTTANEKVAFALPRELRKVLQDKDLEGSVR
jgi:4-hydroxy-3-methylbut-2-enyl diphosphate reductase